MLSQNNEVLVSIVIPAFNEEAYIKQTLSTIREFPPPANYEVIVVDNGSTDHTPNLVEEEGVKLVKFNKGTISAVRNRGVRDAKGKILIFIDADVLVTDEWSENLKNVIRSLLQNSFIVTGSRCLAPNNGNWFNKYWFSHLTSYDAPYINSGHLITTRVLFDKIGGFSEELKTAEDYDFCMKAKKNGAEIKNNRNLKVIHLGYPQTISGFIRRERWHGRQDFETLSSFVESKMAWAAAFNLLVFLLSLIVSVLEGNAMLLLIYPAVMSVIAITLTIVKFGFLKKSLLRTSAIFFLYLIGRSLALVDRIKKK